MVAAFPSADTVGDDAGVQWSELYGVALSGVGARISGGGAPCGSEGNGMAGGGAFSDGVCGHAGEWGGGGRACPKGTRPAAQPQGPDCCGDGLLGSMHDAGSASADGSGIGGRDWNGAFLYSLCRDLGLGPGADCGACASGGDGGRYPELLQLCVCVGGAGSDWMVSGPHPLIQCCSHDLRRRDVIGRNSVLGVSEGRHFRVKAVYLPYAK